MLAAYFNMTGIAEWCAFIASIFLLKKRTGIWRLFILFLLFTIIVETIGWHAHFYLQKNNNWIFNILLLVALPFLIWIFAKEPMAKTKTKLYGIATLFIIASLIDMFFLEGFVNYAAYCEVSEDILLAAVACFFLYNILTEEVFRDLFQYEYFWLANGLLFYSLGNIVLYSFLNGLRDFYQATCINIYSEINGGLNILFYGSLTIAFLCRNRATK